VRSSKSAQAAEPAISARSLCDAGSSSGRTANSCSPLIRSGVRLVARMVRFLDVCRSAVTSRGWHEMLEIVEHDQHLPSVQQPGEPLLDRFGAGTADTKCLGNRGEDERGVGDRGEMDEDRTVREVRFGERGGVDSEARFADTAGAGQGEQAHIGSCELGSHHCGGSLSPDEGSKRARKLIEHRCFFRSRNQADDRFGAVVRSLCHPMLLPDTRANHHRIEVPRHPDACAASGRRHELGVPRGTPSSTDDVGSAVNPRR